MKKIFCDQCKNEIISFQKSVRRLEIDSRHFEHPQGIHYDLELCNTCYNSWIAVIKYTLSLNNNLKDHLFKTGVYQNER